MFVTIQIKSSNLKSLKRYLKLIQKLVVSEALNLKTFLKGFTKKKKQKVFTILKSPHVNKTSQEQFEYNLVFKQFNIYSFQLFKFIVFLKRVQKVSGFGIGINIKFIKDKSYLVEYLTLEKYKIKWYNNRLTKNYLRLIDFHGNSVL